MAEVSATSTAVLPPPLPEVDTRTRLPRTALRIERVLVEAFGGPDRLSPQQRVVVRQLSVNVAMREAVFAHVANGTWLLQDAVPAITALSGAVNRDVKVLGMRVPEKVLRALDYAEQYATESGEARAS